MVVRKCNVCGKVYDEPWSKNRTERVAEMTIYAVPDSAPVENEGYREYPRTDSNEYLDLCSECLEKVEEFIEVLKAGEKYGLIIDPEKYDLVLREE